MDRLAKIKKLNALLIAEMPTLKIGEILDDLISQRKVF